jgi:hypothetical protein
MRTNLLRFTARAISGAILNMPYTCEPLVDARAVEASSAVLLDVLLRLTPPSVNTVEYHRLQVYNGHSQENIPKSSGR